MSEAKAETLQEQESNARNHGLIEGMIDVVEDAIGHSVEKNVREELSEFFMQQDWIKQALFKYENETS